MKTKRLLSCLKLCPAVKQHWNSLTNTREIKKAWDLFNARPYFTKTPTPKREDYKNSSSPSGGTANEEKRGEDQIGPEAGKPRIVKIELALDVDLGAAFELGFNWLWAENLNESLESVVVDTLHVLKPSPPASKGKEQFVAVPEGERETEHLLGTSGEVTMMAQPQTQTGTMPEEAAVLDIQVVKEQFVAVPEVEREGEATMMAHPQTQTGTMPEEATVLDIQTVKEQSVVVLVVEHENEHLLEATVMATQTGTKPEKADACEIQTAGKTPMDDALVGIETALIALPEVEAALPAPTHVTHNRRRGGKVHRAHLGAQRRYLPRSVLYPPCLFKKEDSSKEDAKPKPKVRGISPPDAQALKMLQFPQLRYKRWELPKLYCCDTAKKLARYGMHAHNGFARGNAPCNRLRLVRNLVDNSCFNLKKKEETEGVTGKVLQMRRSWVPQEGHKVFRESPLRAMMLVDEDEDWVDESGWRKKKYQRGTGLGSVGGMSRRTGKGKGGTPERS